MDARRKRTWIASAVAMVFLVVGGINQLAIGIERVSGWASGAIVEDSERAIQKADEMTKALPVIGNETVQTILLVAGFGLLLYLPISELVAWLRKPSGWDGKGDRPLGEFGDDVNLGQVARERKIIRSGKVIGVPHDKYLESIKCPMCRGMGIYMGFNHNIKCPPCDGGGELPGELKHLPQCVICAGSGINQGQECVGCHGIGVRV